MTTATHKRTDKEIRIQLEAQLAEHLAAQPNSTRSANKWMKRVEAVGLGIVVAAFALALYGSFTWADTHPSMIPAAWFFFATCCSLMALLFGLHTILIHAFPPVILPGKLPKFASGSAATWMGGAIIVIGLILAGVWVGYGYSTVTFNLALIAPLSNILGILVTIVIVFSIYQKLTQSR